MNNRNIENRLANPLLTMERFRVKALLWVKDNPRVIAAWMGWHLTYCFSFKALSAKDWNFELYEAIRKQVLESFTREILLDPDLKINDVEIKILERNVSQICNLFLTEPTKEIINGIGVLRGDFLSTSRYMQDTMQRSELISSIVPMNLRSCLMMNSSPNTLYDQTGQYALPYSPTYFEETQSTSMGLCALAATGMLYLAVPNLFENLTSKNWHRLLRYFTFLTFTLMGLDVMTNCFGVMNIYLEASNLYPTACARACNEGLFVNATLTNNERIIFEGSNKDEIVFSPQRDFRIGFVQTILPLTACLIAKFGKFKKPQLALPSDIENQKTYVTDKRALL